MPPMLAGLAEPRDETLAPRDGTSPLARAWVLDFVMSGWLLATVLLLVIAGDRVPGALWLAAAHAAALGLYWILKRAARRSRLWLWVFLLCPFAYVPGIFTALGFIIPSLRAEAVAAAFFDEALAGLDLWLFGSEPTAWFEPVLNPFTGFLLQFCYLAYLFVPVVLAVTTLRNRRLHTFLSYSGIIVATFFTTYLGYYLVPAVGPRYYFDYAEPLPLGPAAQAINDALDYLEKIKLNAFPSGHTALSVVCLLLLFRESRRMGRLMTPFVIGLVVSTVALRYHYAVDVLAGLAVAAAWVGWGARLCLRFDRRAAAAA